MVVNRALVPPRGAYLLLLGACEYFTLYGKRSFEEVTVDMKIFSLSGGLGMITRVLTKRWLKKIKVGEEQVTMEASGWSHRKMGIMRKGTWAASRIWEAENRAS